MSPTRADCHDLLLDIMNRLDSIEEPKTVKQIWALLREVNGCSPDAARTRAAQMLVPLLTPSEAARLRALMEASPLE